MNNQKKSSPPGKVPGNKLTDIVLVVAGQVVTALFYIYISDSGLSVFYILAGTVLSGIGLGLCARRTGRRIIPWIFLVLFPYVLGPVIGLVVMLTKGTKPVNVDNARPVNMYVHILIAFVLFLFGAIIYDSLSLAAVSFLVAIIWFATRKEGRYTRKIKFIAIGIYALMLVMVVVVKNVNDRISRGNAKVIIAACEQYKGRTGAYPARLDDLVPGYLTKIPIARYTYGSGEFHYHLYSKSPGDEYTLTFTNEAPFRREIYDSKSKTWRVRD